MSSKSTNLIQEPQGSTSGSLTGTTHFPGIRIRGQRDKRPVAPTTTYPPSFQGQTVTAPLPRSSASFTLVAFWASSLLTAQEEKEKSSGCWTGKLGVEASVPMSASELQFPPFRSQPTAHSEQNKCQVPPPSSTFSCPLEDSRGLIFFPFSFLSFSLAFPFRLDPCTCIC